MGHRLMLCFLSHIIYDLSTASLLLIRIRVLLCVMLDMIFFWAPCDGVGLFMKGKMGIAVVHSMSMCVLYQSISIRCQINVPVRSKEETFRLRPHDKEAVT